MLIFLICITIAAICVIIFGLRHGELDGALFASAGLAVLLLVIFLFIVEIFIPNSTSSKIIDPSNYRIFRDTDSVVYYFTASNGKILECRRTDYSIVINPTRHIVVENIYKNMYGREIRRELEVK